MKLPGYPTTAQGWDKLVKTKGWEFVEAHGRGRGGIRREYSPPPEVMALIGARQLGEPPVAPVRQPVRPRVTAPVVEADEGMELKPPRIGGSAVVCPGCGAFTGLIKAEGRVHLEFDAPDYLTFMHVALALKPSYQAEDVDALLDLTSRAFSVLSLITAGNHEGISNLLSKPKLVNALSAFCEELNATPHHDNSISE